MIIRLCDFCGRETACGKDIPVTRLTYSKIPLSKRFKREEHTDFREVRVKVLIGIDGIDPEGDQKDAATCGSCARRILDTLADHIAGSA